MRTYLVGAIIFGVLGCARAYLGEPPWREAAMIVFFTVMAVLEAVDRD